LQNTKIKITDKRSLTYKGRHIRLAADLSTETWQVRKDWKEIIQCAKWEKYVVKNTLSSKTAIQNRRRDKEFPRQAKTKGVYEH